MALMLLRVFLAGVLAAAADDVPITWKTGGHAELPCVAPLGERLQPRRQPLPLNDDQPRARVFVWRRDGEEVSQKRVSPSGSLDVPRSRKDAEGVYQCLVRHHGGWVLGYPTHLKFATLDKEFSGRPLNVKARSGQPFALPCSIESQPPASISWLKNDLPLWEDTRHFYLKNQLLITDVSEEDKGSYRCVATNPYLNKSRTSPPGQLNIQFGAGDQDAALLHTNHDTDIYAPRGSRVVLPCPVTGSPRPKLMWELLPPGGSKVNELDVVVEVFVIQSLEADQQGVYTCSVEENKQINKNFTVALSQPARITIPPSGRVVLRAGTVRFNCTADGLPEPTVTWFKDGQPLAVGSDRINWRKSADGKRNELVISGVTTDDAGVYQCFASNPTSTVSSWALLNVTGADAVAPTNVRCWPMGDRRIKVSWDEPPGDVLAYTLHGTSEDENAGSSLYPLDTTEKIVEVKTPFVPYRFQVRTYGKKSTVSDMSAPAICQGQGVPIRMAKLADDRVIVSWRQFSEENPGVVQWILEVRGQGREYNVTLDGAEHNYTIYAPPPLGASVRVLGSRGSWLPQDLTLVPWSSTADAGDDLDDGVVTAVPDGLAVTELSATNFTVTWQCELAHRYTYTVCYKGEDMEGKICMERKNTSATFSDLQSGTEYTVIIQARLPRRSLGGPFSQPFTVTTPPKSSLRFKNLTASYVDASRIRVSWNGAPSRYRVHYSGQLKLPVENWTSVDTNNNTVVIPVLDPEKTFLMVIGYDPLENSRIYTVPPYKPQKVEYNYTSDGILLNVGPAPALVSYSNNISEPLEHWRNETVTGGVILLVTNKTLTTFVRVTQENSNYSHMLTIRPPQAAMNADLPQQPNYWIYTGTSIALGILLLAVMGVAATYVWRRRKRALSPLRSRRRNLESNDDNVEEAEMKLARGRGGLANGGAGAGAGARGAGRPLLNGHVHITENPTSKTPNGRMRKGHRYEAAFDVSRYEDPETTQETVLDDSLHAPTLLDTSRRELDLSRPSHMSANNSFAKLPDDNMNSELTRSSFQLDNSTIQPTLQPNG